MRKFIIILYVLVVAGCHSDTPSQEASSQSGSKQSSVESRSRIYDYGDLANYQNCQAEPRRNLSKQEECIIKLLSDDCTPQADCLVTCESSPDGWRTGGGCHHICFGPITGYRWSSRPQVDLADCDRFVTNQEPQGGS